VRLADLKPLAPLACYWYFKIMNGLERKCLDDFYAELGPLLSGYKHSTFSYLALRRGTTFELIQGRLQMQGVATIIEPRYFQSENIAAGQFRLEDVQRDPQVMVEDFLSGVVKTPQHDLKFPFSESQSYSLYFDKLHSDGIAQQVKQCHLYIRGNRREHLLSPRFDWELKAAKMPYDSISELLVDYAIGPINGDSAEILVVAMNVAGIGGDSRVSNGRATLTLNLAHGLETSKASLGYRIIDKQIVVKRASIAGTGLTWSRVGNFQHGEAEIEVPPPAVLHCFACYAGNAQHHYWIADPANSQNPLRAVHLAFDSKLEALRDLIERAQTRGSNARDLEIAVGWLLWILGFSPTPIGATPKTGDAPDLIATTPQGHFLVVECTTGILKEDHKLAHLIQRAEKTRQSLIASNNRHLRVLPIIVTTKSRDEVKAELEQAYKLGVLVATREDFDPIINRTLVFPDAGRLYAEAEATLQRHQSQLTLPIVEARSPTVHF